MLRGCVQLANNLRIALGTTCERLSTVSMYGASVATSIWVQPRVTPFYVDRLSTSPSTALSLSLHLLGEEFSPLSTEPINKTTFYKKGEI